MNFAQVTTGPPAFAIGSVLRFEVQPFLGGLLWDLTGGSASLKLTDPQGNAYSVSGSIVGRGAQASFTVPGPLDNQGHDITGNWSRAWVLTDAAGTHLVSLPITFFVVNSPGTPPV